MNRTHSNHRCVQFMNQISGLYYSGPYTLRSGLQPRILAYIPCIWPLEHTVIACALYIIDLLIMMIKSYE